MTSVTLLREDRQPLGKLALDIALQHTPALNLPDMQLALITNIDPKGISGSTTITDAESACILVNGSQPMYEPLRAFHASSLPALPGPRPPPYYVLRFIECALSVPSRSVRAVAWKLTAVLPNDPVSSGCFHWVTEIG